MRQLVAQVGQAWVEPLSAREPSITVVVPNRGRACLFDIEAKAPRPCQEVEAGREVTIAMPSARMLVAIDAQSGSAQ